MNGSALYSDVVLPGGDLVREARPLVDRPAPVRPLVQPGDPAAVGDAKTDFDIFKPDRRAVHPSSPGSTSASRTDLVAAPLLHDTPDELAQPLGEVRDWKRGECEPVPGKTMPKLVAVERDYTAVLPTSGARSARSSRSSGRRRRASRWKPTRRGRRAAAPRTARSTGARALDPRRRHGARRSSRSPASRTAGWRVEGFRALEKRTGTPPRRPRRGARRRADHVRRHAGAAAQGDRLAGVVGDGVARAPLLAVHDQRRARRPVADADRAPAALRRPRVDARVRRGPAHLPAADRRPPASSASSSPATRPRTRCTSAGSRPHSKWSIHSEFQDNLHMLTLFRGGPVMWLSVEDAADDRGRRQRLGRGLQPQRRRRLPRGRLAPRPDGRRADVPLAGPARERARRPSSRARAAAPTTRSRGSRSSRRYLVGGYAQLSYGFNYYGPTGPQRDEMVVVRKLLGEVEY